jgi:hypothetical protein
MEKPITYGLYDLQDRCWLGNAGNGKEGRPNTYTDPEMARAAATVTTRMLKWRPGRIMALPFHPKKLHFKDKVNAVLSGEEAIDELVKEAK